MDDIPLNFEGLGTNALPGNQTTDHAADFGDRLGSILTVVLTIGMLLLLLYLVWGAVEWLTSGGDSSKLQAARNRMMHAIVGILLLSGSLALYLFVQWILGIEVLEFI